MYRTLGWGDLKKKKIFKDIYSEIKLNKGDSKGITLQNIFLYSNKLCSFEHFINQIALFSLFLKKLVFIIKKEKKFEL